VVATITDKGRQLVSAIPFLDGTAIKAAVDRMTAPERERIANAFNEFNGAVRQAEDDLVEAAIEA
jgi:hypothetical protein